MRHYVQKLLIIETLNFRLLLLTQYNYSVTNTLLLQAVETCVAAAGFSVGEFAALVFSGSMNFAEGNFADMFFFVMCRKKL